MDVAEDTHDEHPLNSLTRDEVIRDDAAARLLASMPVGFILWDARWRCVAVNRVGEQLCGRPAAELMGNVLWDLFPDVVGTEFEAVCRRVAATGRPDAVEIFYAEPVNRWLDIHLARDRQGVAAYYLDVTDRHAVADKLSRLAAHDRTVAQTLQGVLLPSLPTIEGVDIAARYVTAEGSDEVGGDWYDIALSPTGALSAIIGDVCGHDIAAAATMGQLRSMLRMNAWEHDDAPSAILTRLDQAARDLGIRTTASVVIARIETNVPDTVTLRGSTDSDARGRQIRMSNAGHPPPVVLDSAGRTRVLATAHRDLLLGVDPYVVRSDHAYPLPPHSTLFLYTDGLIETRDNDLEHGLRRLRDALHRHHALPLEDLLGAVVADLVGDEPDDDVAVLALRFRGSGPA